MSLPVGGDTLKRISAALAANILIFTASLAQTGAPIPGLNALLARPSLKYLIIGEMHGTAEMPDAFGDLAMEMAHQGPLTVALEYSDADPSLDAYLHSKGTAADRAALLNGRLWTYPNQDGRTSKAMLDLIERLRVAIATNPGLRVVPCQPSRARGDIASNREMGACWKAAGDARPEAVVLVLVGNVHASLIDQRGFAPAASLLPSERTVSLMSASPGGEAWNCQEDGCAPHQLGPANGPTARGIHLGSIRDGAYSGVFAPGGLFTASPPTAPLIAP